MKKRELLKMILVAIPLALGIAIIVLSQAGEPITNFEALVGISVVCLALAVMTTVDTEAF
jgi:hypothetical protein